MAASPATGKKVLSAPPAARAALASRQATAPPPASARITSPRSDGRLSLNAKSLKATAVVDGVDLIRFEVPAGSPPIEFTINAQGRKVTGRFNAKSLRKAVTAVNEIGADGVAVVIQGRLAGGVLEEAGISITVKPPKPAAAP